MNAIQQTHDHTSTSGTFKRVCLASCRKLLTQIESSKDAIFDEFRDLIGGQERMLRLALNEAEAMRRLVAGSSCVVTTIPSTRFLGGSLQLRFHGVGTGGTLQLMVPDERFVSV